MTMQIRVLTGTHAGARLDLLPGCYGLGSDSRADIRIEDWPGGPFVIEVDSDGQIRYHNDEASSATFTAMHPVRFGDVVLCVGDCASQWPSDMELIERLLPSPSPSQADAPPRKRQHKALRAGLGAILALGAAALVPALQPAFLSEAAPPPREQNQYAQVKAVLGQLRLGETRIAHAGAQLRVEGLVASSADAARLRLRLSGYRPAVKLDVIVVDEVLATIRDTLADRNLNVRYEGRGVFSIAGQSDDAERTARRIDELRSDLGSQIGAIHVDVIQQDPSTKLPAHYDAALLADGLHYVETPDGTKHLSSTGY
ncbi:HrpD5 family protein [Xanthomonas sp. NCPPB 1638]|uniref:HrpD5 family protein n=1 Tax=Xanthomonas TaxID=338 RepID=UPI00132E99C1|nr:HrpD5 family protein [Xanthomonas cucurbitae]QHG88384.1 serine kinase [Xanthomonas cucurbitae]WDM74951.1 serine kinase [Xanthomonas cucurbitae]